MARISCVHLPYLAVLYLLAFSAMDDGARARGIDFSRIVQLSAWKPRAYLYRNFLTDDECDHIIKIATPRLQRSSVADNTDGHSELSSIRTSSGMFIAVAEDAVIARIEARIAQWTFLPLPNQEAMQVLRYEKGQKYEPHVDYFHDPNNRKRGGHRYATVLMYLNNVTKGGETVFPTADDPSPKDDSWTECAKGKLAVKPSKGDALLFYSMHPDGSPDPSSLHYACPVVEGVKWSAPKWIHVADFSKTYSGPSGGVGLADMAGGGQGVLSGCIDANALVACAFVSEQGSMCVCEWTVEHVRFWAASGECEKNPAYMHESCRKSCKQC
ncbi:unnamed protein product [Closterium sp. NIES-64]|nr:unnamed protein product [Closterium sp. NIES-64]